MKRLALVTLTISGTLLAMGLLWVLAPTAALFGGSLALSAALRPLVARLEARGVPRGLAIVCWYLVVVLGLGGIFFCYGWYLRTSFADSVAALGQAYSGLITAWQQGAPWQQALAARISQALSGLTDNAGNFNILVDLGNQLLALAGGIVSEAVFVLAVLALAYYWLAEVEHFERVMLSVLPVTIRVRAREIWRNVDSVVGAYVRTTVVAVILAWLLLFVVYSLCNLPFAATLALLGGLAHLVPRVGPAIGILPAVLLALTLSPWQALLVLLGAGAAQFVVQRIGERLLQSQSVRVNPLLQVLALLALAQLGGLTTMIFAPPLAALVQVLYANLQVVRAAPQPEDAEFALLREQLQRISATAPEIPELNEALRRGARLLNEAEALLGSRRA